MPELTEKEVLLIMTIMVLLEKQTSPVTIKNVYEGQKKILAELRKEPGYQMFVL
jgi:hypothetical protein